MSSTNGHARRKLAIPYARVSTEEQARRGYSLAQQLEACRAWCAREGYEILEEVVDPGQSGATLERPGLDHVRDLVAIHGRGADELVVLAQDRDRLAREPAYLYLLREEFEEHEAKIRALSDRGDDSPEGQLTDGILDQLAKFERAKIAERSRRGKLRKAREGKIIANRQPVYGFRFTEDRNGYEVDEETMPVVRRIFEMVAGGATLGSIKKAFDREGVPTPSSGRPTRGDGRFWSQAFLKNCIMHEAYRSRTVEEIEALVSPEVARGLDPERRYCIWWFGRKRHTYKQKAESAEDGTRRYRKTKTSVAAPREQWIGVPVPDSGIPRELVDLAREAVRYNRTAAKAAARTWELSGGIFRCGVCGRAMSSVSTGPKERQRFYYRCPNRAINGLEACKMSKHFRAETLEAEAWEEVSSLLKDPERLRVGVERMIEEEKRALRGDGGARELKHWHAELAKTERARDGYLDQQAEGVISMAKLKEKLAVLDERRETAEAELDKLTHHQERIAQLERETEALMEAYRHQASEGLDLYTPEDIHDAYRTLGIEIAAHPDGTAELKGSKLVAMRRNLERLSSRSTCTRSTC